MLDNAVELLQKGLLNDARRICARVLRLQPKHFDALHLCGVIAFQEGSYQEAVELLSQAVEVCPGHGGAHNTLGAALHVLKRLNEAVVSYEVALRNWPNYSEAHFNLGNALYELGQIDASIESYNKALSLGQPYARAFNNRGRALQRVGNFEDAVASYDQAIRIAPDYCEAHNNRGTALQRLGHLDDSVACYDTAINIRPDFFDAHYNRGTALQDLARFSAAIESYDRAIALMPQHASAHNNRGTALHSIGLLNEAIASYERAIAIRPDHADAHFNRANALLELNRPDEALLGYDTAIGFRPHYSVAHNNRGNALQCLNRFEAAIASYDAAICTNENYFDAYSNRGTALQELRLHDAAIESFDKAIRINPDYAEAYWNKSLALLLSGDYETGWKLYEWRWKRSADTSRPRRFIKPQWDGNDPLRNKTILLHSEQGLGDTIQFCRYGKLLSEQGATVIAEVPFPLVRLLAGLEGISTAIPYGSTLPTYDFHCPFLSLPLAFRTRINSIPSAGGYISVNKTTLAAWDKRLGPKTGLRVGLAWSGSEAHSNDKNRSFSLSSWLPFLPPQFDYVSLQKQVRDIDIPALASANIRHYGQEIDDLMDTAALCELVDIVISVDTCVAHLSGALNKTVWILLPYSPDWRWLLERSDSPWYRSASLYRQSSDRDWRPVLERIQEDLAALNSAEN